MLPLEVVGPGGSLSTVLVATPYWQDTSQRESWQAATATAAYSCVRMTAALVHRLGSGGSGGAGQFRWRRILNLFLFHLVNYSSYSYIRISLYSAFSYEKNC